MSIGIGGLAGTAVSPYLRPRNGKEDEKETATKEKETTGNSTGNSIKEQVEALKAQVEKKTGKKDATADNDAQKNAHANSTPNGGAATATDKDAAKEKDAYVPAAGGVVTAETPSASMLDRLKEMQDGFVNQLFQSMGLGSVNEGGKGVNLEGLASGIADKLGLGDLLGGLGKNGYSALAVSAQYSLNISAVMSVMNADGSMTQHNLNFSLEASFDYLGVANGKGAGLNSLDKLFGATKNDKTEGASSTGNAFLDKMREMFSPENTAQRILDFSLGFFGNSKQFKQQGDTPDARTQFADYIGAAIQKGFDQAFGALGKIPKDTQDELDRTHTLVFNGLEDFKNYQNKQNNNLANSLQYFASSLSLNYAASSVYYSPEEVKQMNATAAKNNPYATANTATAATASHAADEATAAEKAASANTVV
ncbi:hypothetical protein FACS1894139_13760 [Planctomycetales bacterium]|nr:hypothetical protein FACS1894107_06720 [Planctomycetales bacterium]GHS98616.1 hypothetical protein FACS1894108_07080 [Planctomycetales bacterium]GHT06869.1 hypothetical protein FACS1894139_13760 [Planctomycetales bacterium]